jgi:hypothetical protein
MATTGRATKKENEPCSPWTTLTTSSPVCAPRGAELLGELVQYQDSYRLCYIRGPEGIIVALAEQLS